MALFKAKRESDGKTVWIDPEKYSVGYVLIEPAKPKPRKKNAKAD